MCSSAEIAVVLTLGSPKRLNISSVTSRMRSAVRRGFFFSAISARPAARRALSAPSGGSERSEAPSGTFAADSCIGAARSACLQSRPMPAVSFQEVGKTYSGPRGDLRALDHVSFDIEQGEFFGLLGPNGAGKTTLISILAGLTRASSGRVNVMGHDVVHDYAAARKALGVVPQELVFDPFFSVRETLRIQSGYFGVHDNDAWIDELLSALGLAD